MDAMESKLRTINEDIERLADEFRKFMFEVEMIKQKRYDNLESDLLINNHSHFQQKEISNKY